MIYHDHPDSAQKVAHVQTPKDAKQQIEEAMMAVMEKRHAMEEDEIGRSSQAP